MSRQTGRRSVPPDAGEDERYYLRDGFDPASLTITQLRNVMAVHDVDFPPSGAKKATWVEHFKVHVLPRAAEFLSEYDNISPHGAGIVDAAPPKRSARSRSPAKRSPSKSERKSAVEPIAEIPAATEVPPVAELTAPVVAEPASPSKSRSRTTRAKSPAKGTESTSASTKSKPPPSPSRRSRKTDSTTAPATAIEIETVIESTVTSSEPVPNILESAISLAPPGTLASAFESTTGDATSTATTKSSTSKASSSPKKTRKTLKQQYVDPSEYELNTQPKTEKTLNPVSITGTSPRKSIKEEPLVGQGSSDRNVFQKPTPQKASESPFSNKNIFQKGSPSSPKARKRAHKEVEESTDSPQPSSAKKRAKDTTPKRSAPKDTFSSIVQFDNDVTMADDTKSVPYFTPHIPQQPQEVQPQPDLKQPSEFQPVQYSQYVQPLQQEQQQPIPATPGSVRRFTSFPNTPEDDHSNTQATPSRSPPRAPPATAPHNSVRDHSFPRASSSKRLSFMPDVKHLRVSDEFSRQLQQEQQEKKEPAFVLPEQLNDNPKQDQESTEVKNEETEQEAEPVTDGRVGIEVIKKGEVAAEDLHESDLEKYHELEREIEEEDRALKKKLRKQHKKRSKSKAESTDYVELFFSALAYVFRVTATLSLVFYASWWCVERFRIGYCDVLTSPEPRTISIPSQWIEKASPYVSADSLYKFENYINQAIEYGTPECVPCPEHAACYPNFRVACEEGYVPVQSLISLGGTLPFPPTCVPDMARRNKVAALAKRAVEILRKRNANVKCGITDESTPEISEDKLRQELLKQTIASLSEEEFNDLWRQALKDIENEKDIIVRQDKLTFGYAVQRVQIA
ncbi:Src1p [Sugiyamaella lignohabitans]|uniref:Src1p n=1 Tax=Sugiyamaella lignohabitans TaxID=796027 RepID=A0A167F154_9ASCO|nr:Src1p [Sugiyamaella lignohabitans]ANB14692.1 Src1p [Sugiyamaella lignohabitans]